MAEDEFTKLFKYMSERFDKLDEKLEKKADTALVEKVLALVDKIAKRQEIDDEERLVMGHQQDRMDRWVHELADKIGYKLSA